MAGLGAQELLIVLLIVVVIFGSARIPKLARSVGEAQRELRLAREENAQDRAT